LTLLLADSYNALGGEPMSANPVTRRVRLDFPLQQVREPVFYRLIVDFGLVPNVYRANIDLPEGGFVELDIAGDPDDVRRGLEWVAGCGVRVTVIEAS